MLAVTIIQIIKKVSKDNGGERREKTRRERKLPMFLLMLSGKQVVIL